MNTWKELQGLDAQKIAEAIEADAGQTLPGLRESLAEAKVGKFAAAHTPAQIAARKSGRAVGSTKPNGVVPTDRFEPDAQDFE